MTSIRQQAIDQTAASDAPRAQVLAWLIQQFGLEFMEELAQDPEFQQAWASTNPELF